jgi:hypothetical protein
MLTKDKFDEIDDSLEHSSKLFLRCIAEVTGDLGLELEILSLICFQKEL